MRRRFRSQGVGSDGSKTAYIDMTPLIDLAFSLLIIFMITTPLLERSLPIALPVTQKSLEVNAAQSTPAIEVIHIDEHAQYYWGTEPVSLEELTLRMAEAAKLPELPILHIRGAGQGTYQSVATVISIAERYHLTRIHLDTKVGTAR